MKAASIFQKTLSTGIALALTTASSSLLANEGAYSSDNALATSKSNNNPVVTLANEAPKPNFIIIYADDLGYGDVGAYGAKDIATPNIDKMAENGLKFTSLYAGSSVSTPSRASMLTGRYPSRMGIKHVYQADTPSGLDPEEVTIAEQLKQSGYHTGLIGKWHLGHTAQYTPRNHGFDEFKGVLFSNDMPNFFFYENENRLDDPVDQRYLTKRYTEQAVDFIKKNKNAPFFLYLAHNMPHIPLYASPDFVGSSKRGLYGDVVQELDWGIGEVIKALEDAGIDENTMVVFTSDNGPWLTMRDDGGSAGNLRDGKTSTFDGGQKVPAIAYWPGHIKPRVDDNHASMLDWFPTLSEIANVAIPNDRAIDGESILPRLLGENQKPTKPFFYQNAWTSELDGIRDGDWKLKLAQSGYPEILEPIMKWSFYSHDTVLFNVKENPEETEDLSSQYPEKVQELTDKIQNFKAELDKEDVKLSYMKSTPADRGNMIWNMLQGPLIVLSTVILFIIGLIWGARRLWKKRAKKTQSA